MPLARLEKEIVACRLCPRLVEWRERVAREKKAAHKDEDYWGRPVPGFGDPGAEVLVLGLAPAAHGANRKGRYFTGDRSGDFLFDALYATGFSSSATSRRADDGIRLNKLWISAAVRCAPPANKPLPEEIGRCREYLAREWQLLTRLRAVLVLGRIAQDGLLAMLRATSRVPPRARFAFGHGLRQDLGGGVALFGSYHPSQQNTFTGRLTPGMLDDVFARAKQLAGVD